MTTAFLASLAQDLAPAVGPEAERAGVYVLSAIVGLLVAGAISCAREIRRSAQSRA